MSRTGGADGTGVDPTEARLDRSPPYLSSGLALAAGVVAVTTSVDSQLGVVCAVGGLFGLALGLLTARQGFVTLGGGLLVLGPVVAGTTGVPPVVATLVGVTAGLLAFDFGSTGIALGEQLGRDTPTAQVELVHAIASTVVGLGFVIAGFAVHETAAAGQPVSAVLALVVAVVILLAALRRADPLSAG